MSLSRTLRWALPLLAVMLCSTAVFGQDAPTGETAIAEATGAAEAVLAEAQGPSLELFTTNNLWMMICIGLVFLMHMGFATLESGLCRSKNCVNILTKNIMVPMIGVLLYYAIGFNLMYPDGGWTVTNWLGGFVFGIGAGEAGVTSAYNPGYTYWTDFLFQAMFCATACTIVSGSMAERVKLVPFLVFAAIFTALAYPFVGSWKWGGGWLDSMTTPFYDFAGSTMVHSMGGWAALVGIILLGPRLGKYNADGSVNPVFGHSMPLATCGAFMLFLGWFGFNGGSVLSADPGLVSLVLVTTCLAGAAGTVAAYATSAFMSGKPDLSMILNGALAGLVGITAGADLMSPGEAIIIGLIAGILVVLSVYFFDKLKIDDPVGALSVHLVNGIWGTLAVGIFGSAAGGAQLMSQLIGIVAVAIATIALSFIIFSGIKATMGIRVGTLEELEGLDIGEHGMRAYPDFPTELVGSEGAPGSTGSPSAVPAHA